MKKIVILMPVYNDWESLVKLLNEIDKIIEDIKNFKFKCVIINDSSTFKKPHITKPQNLDSLKIINMKINRGHARCNAAGLRYINSKENFDYLIVMDSDGEDRPIEIKDFINKIIENQNTSIVAKRVKRSEGPVFKILYMVHKFITFIFTGKKINFGNFSCITKQDVSFLKDKPSLWSSFSGSLKRNITNLNEINSTRGVRYFGPSKMSLVNLILHSFSIIAVFKYSVFFRSTIMIVVLFYLYEQAKIASITLQISLLLFNILIFFISLRENKKDLEKSTQNILNEEEITH